MGRLRLGSIDVFQESIVSQAGCSTFSNIVSCEGWNEGENGGENDVALRCPEMQNSSGAEADPG